jgi:hypothetical protein
VFFPEKGETNQVLVAKRICNKCSFKQECGEYSLYFSVLGVWGGMSGADRRYIRNQLRITPKELLPLTAVKSA